MPARLPDWPLRLTAAVAARRAARAALGRNDCVMFVADCIEAMTGLDLAVGLRGSYRSRREAERLLKRLAGGGLGELATAVAARQGFAEIAPSLAATGDVLLTSVDGRPALAVMLNGRVVVSGRRGLARKTVADCTRAWRI